MGKNKNSLSGQIKFVFLLCLTVAGINLFGLSNLKTTIFKISYAEQNNLTWRKRLFITTLLKSRIEDAAHFSTLLDTLKDIDITAIDISGVLADTALTDVLQNTDMRHISHDLWPRIQDYGCFLAWTNVKKDRSKLQTWRCIDLADPNNFKIENMTYDKLIDFVTKYLEKPSVKQNKNTIGFYVLDDWENANAPGQAKKILEDVHTLIVASNKKYGLDRKTICYFAAWIPRKNEKIETYHGIGDNAKNFTAKGCDIISINSYAAKSYGGSTAPQDYDWDMNFLPQVKKVLKLNGWKPSMTPFIGGVQTYGNDPSYPPTSDVQWIVLPRTDDVRRQALAFCKQNAESIWFWPWHDYTGGSGNKLVSPSTSQQLFNGVVDGIIACKEYWGIANTPTPTPIASPSCLCSSGDACDPSCSFDKYTDINYSNPIKCSRAGSLAGPTPNASNKNAYCVRNLRTKGDADGQNGVTDADYDYYTQAVSGGKIDPSINPDFDGDGEVGAKDRVIIIKKLTGN